MAKYINEGKIFEEDFASSINKETIFLHRLKDTAQSYNQSKDTKYTWNNPCDYFLFNGEIFFCFELKSTKSKKYLSIEQEIITRVIPSVLGIFALIIGLSCIF